MASSRRLKIREELEGIHKNCDWLQAHCIKAVNIIGPDNPLVAKGFTSLAALAQTLDDFASDIYSTI